MSVEMPVSADKRKFSLREDTRRITILVYLFTLVSGLLLIGIIFAAPLLRSHESGRLASVVYAVFSPLCHQIPERCFTVSGFPLPVCGRCLGIYSGFLAGTTLYPVLRGFGRLSLPSAPFFVFFTLPLAVDGLAGLLAVWTTPAVIRFATGFLWGSLLPYYFVPGVTTAFLPRRSDKAG